MEATPRRVHLYLSVIILNIIYLAVGTAFAWSSPMLMKLDLTPDESSTVASVLPLGGMLGPFVSGLVVDRLGRKNTAALNMGFMTCSFLLLTFSRNVTILSVGRFMSGMSWGLTFSSLPMYIAEISEDSVRGVLNTINMISIASGSLLMYAVGPFVSYELIHYILLGICAVFFMLFPLLPNSPYALVMNNQVNSARKTLTWLREKRSTSCVEKELQDIQKVVTKNETDSAGSIKDLFTSRGNRRALTVCCTLISLQQLSGITVVLFYVQQIFHATASTISSSTCSIIIGLVKLAAGFVCPVAVKSFGYKTPMIVSTFVAYLDKGVDKHYNKQHEKVFPLNLANARLNNVGDVIRENEISEIATQYDSKSLHQLTHNQLQPGGLR
ncbi:facilitated trehalose transporter Tret1-2 homolog [Homalodisca vitripennis]|uniref:facilitated trehalose transporter Tret1-2 homolog n=1 Tax=Homalodisca vitripennis TaxID=197043 RepID=UPI001EEC43C1|nr:facilitated trehalose transporter Tret1-2 homolog [Homalodisca vitripennis]